MPTLDWPDLPDAARAAVERVAGPVRGAVSAAHGDNSALAARLSLVDGGEVFCKGAPLDARNLWMYRNEARFNPRLGGLAPRLLWTVEGGGWLVLGFESVAGAQADLAPGSPDLPRLAAFLARAAADLTPAPPECPAQRLSARWGLRTWQDAAQAPLDAWEAAYADRLAAYERHAPDAVDGGTLQHTDMTPRNVLVGERLHLTDWSWPALAAPWVDTALTAHRLIAAGHTPAEAETWAATVPAWHHATPEAVTSLAVTVHGLWRGHALRSPAPHCRHLAAAARAWIEHRFTRTGDVSDVRAS
jgi:hypothetical protein